MKFALRLAIMALAYAGMTMGQISQPKIEAITPQGIRMSYQHQSGMTLFAVHYSVNKPVKGVAAGDWNFDVNSPTGNAWIHENFQVKLQPGDTINYWILVVVNGQGRQLTDQSWTSPSPTTKPKPTTTTTRGTTAQPTPKPSLPPGVSTTTSSGGSGGNGNGGSCGPGGGLPRVECDSYPCLVFEDEFETLDFNKWEHEITAGGGGNWEFQYYLNNRSNSYVRDGVLYLKPTLTTDRFGDNFLSSGQLDLWGSAPANLCTGPHFYGCFRTGSASNYINPIQSARIRSSHAFNVRYGKVEVEAQLPRGDWLWPAIWMLPKNEEYGMWPASGEIDIMESRGNDDLMNEKGEQMGNKHMGATLHWGPFFGANAYEKTTVAKTGDFGNSYHTYGVEWDENSLKMTLDGKTILDVDPPAGGFWELGEFGSFLGDDSNPWRFAENKKMAPFDTEFYIIMNLAVGGTNGFFGDNWSNGARPKPWRNASPTAPRDFWQAKDQWYPTWNPDRNNGEDAALKVKSVKVWKLKDN